MSRIALIVEDEKDTGTLLGEHLRRWGFDPTLLNEGTLAVSWVRQNKPDLILLDLLLPGVDGFTICESLKLERDTNLIPIIMITALTDPEDKVHGLQVGANSYLTKPFTSTELQKAVEQAFAWREEIEQTGIEGEIHFKLQSDTRYLEELNHLLSSLFLFSGLSDTQVKQLTTAVCEMGANAIEWGHQKQIERIVTVIYHIDPDKITITIRDTGPGFDPKKLPHAADTEDPVRHMMVREALGIREGGFGILMSQGLVDEMTYNETGNEVRLVKYFPVKAHLRGAGNGQSAATKV
ncbi:MAG TPA: response regulator [Gemmataceae bacterium]|nr:response regulator [Gemmataceae bacterium]